MVSMFTPASFWLACDCSQASVQDVLEDKIDMDVSLLIGRVLVPQVLTLFMGTRMPSFMVQELHLNRHP